MSYSPVSFFTAVQSFAAAGQWLGGRNVAGTGLQWTSAGHRCRPSKAATHDMVIQRQKEKGSR